MITKAVLSAVAGERKRLTSGAPKLRRGRPGSKAARHAARRKKRIEQKVGDLFEHRHLFVQRQVTASERATLRRLYGLMEDVYRLFDRRCRTATALAKLADLQRRLKRFGLLCAVLKKLQSPGLEKALVFLDEQLLGARRARWSVGIVGTARCSTLCTECGLSTRSRSDWGWISSGSVRAKAASPRLIRIR